MARPGAEVEIEIPNEPQRVSELRLFVVRWLRDVGVPDDVASEVILAVDEAATNACLHAADPGAGRIRMNGWAETARVTITVEDNGSGFDPDAMDYSTPGSPWDQDGRGLFLIHELMDAIEVTSSPEGTIVSMTRDLTGSAGGSNGPRSAARL